MASRNTGIDVLVAGLGRTQRLRPGQHSRRRGQV